MNNKIIENYVLHSQIGQGQFGKVYRVTNFVTNEQFAIKIMTLDKLNEVPKLLAMTMNEIQILSNIDNINVIKFIEMLRTSNNLYLVFEYCGGGTLDELLKKQGFIPEKTALKYFQQIIYAFKSLVKYNILHRDLKPSNILFHEGNLKIADFGFCKVLQNDSMAESMVGSPIYMAPEILKGELYDMKADIWSLGVVLYEMLFGICPYEDRTIPKLLNKINQKKLDFPNDKQEISQQTKDLLNKLLVVDSKQRIEWQDLFLMSEQLLDGLPKVIEQKNLENLIQQTMRTLSKERNKSLFLIQVFQKLIMSALGQQDACYQLLKRSKVISVNLLDQLKNYSQRHIQNHEKDIPQVILRNYQDVKDTPEIKQFKLILENECLIIEKLMNSFVEKFQYPLHNEMSYVRSLIYQAEEIQQNLQQNYDQNIQLMGNDVLDCIMDQEFFSQFIDHNKTYLKQNYFQDLKKYNTSQLKNLFEEKFKYIKNNYDYSC